MTTEQKVFEGFAIVELMGHNTIAGYVSEQTIAGAAMLRVDVPAADDDHPAFTKLYGAPAIYAITPTTEEIARAAVKRLRVRPISPYVVPITESSRQLVDSRADDIDDDDEWGDDRFGGYPEE